MQMLKLPRPNDATGYDNSNLSMEKFFFFFTYQRDYLKFETNNK